MPSSAAQEWLDKALEDEQVVRALKNAQGPWPAAAYHVQQAAEKYIKAALVEAGVPPARTHDLPDLLDAFPMAVPQSVEHAAHNLTIYAWLTRYPGGPAVSQADVAQADTYLDDIRAWALGAIP